MISEERVEKAVEYIRDAAKPYAEALAAEKYLDHKRKVIRATQFAEADGTMAERESFAERSQDYRDCINEYRDAVFKRAEIATLIKAAELTIEVWRSQNAQRRNV